MRREGFIKQLRAILLFTRQGIGIRGHTESEENLQQLLKVTSKGRDVVKSWLYENRFTSHQFVNEVIQIMEITVRWNLLKPMKECSGPAWFSLIVDEAKDVSQAEQLHLSIC